MAIGGRLGERKEPSTEKLRFYATREHSRGSIWQPTVSVKQSLIISLSVVLLSCAFAQEKGRDHRRDHRKGPPRPEEFLKAYDLNKDGKVSKKEFAAGKRASRLDPEIRVKIFDRLDKDGDGFISSKELKGMAPKKGPHPLEKADLDKDDRISKEEFASHPPFAKMSDERRDKIFARLDHNSDGFLDQQEGRRGGRNGPRGEKHLPRIRIKGLDLDHNGSLSWREFQKAPAVLPLPENEGRKWFQKLDKDKDGEITSEEIRDKGEPRSGKPEKKPRQSPKK
ncbi:MAG: Ca2+-binding EF-hand superfamily protein [Paracoccaceae bacterium]|jgi:Ca2+-binding EF-hand superfamily protein